MDELDGGIMYGSNQYLTLFWWMEQQLSVAIKSSAAAAAAAAAAAELAILLFCGEKTSFPVLRLVSMYANVKRIAQRTLLLLLST